MKWGRREIETLPMQLRVSDLHTLVHLYIHEISQPASPKAGLTLGKTSYSCLQLSSLGDQEAFVTYSWLAGVKPTAFFEPILLKMQHVMHSEMLFCMVWL